MIKFIFFPFSFLYKTITSIRNLLYDVGIFKYTSFNIPIISVGNLTMGGTGKSPHTMYLIELLKDQYKLGVLSRGYGRKTKGYILANESSNAEIIGDEPYQFHKRYNKEIPVAVCEDRVTGVRKLLNDKKIDLVLLDDAFQHRRIKPSFSILLTEYNSLFTKDYVFPMGKLREAKQGYKRADILIVTKCPENLSIKEKEKIKLELILKQPKEVFFSSIIYSKKLLSAKESIEIEDLKNKEILLITGIANPKPLHNYLKKYSSAVVLMEYSDHHNFSNKEISKILSVYNSMGNNKIMVTSEKDFMRLEKEKALNNKLFYLPISVEIDRKVEFDTLIKKNSKL